MTAPGLFDVVVIDNGLDELFVLSAERGDTLDHVEVTPFGDEFGLGKVDIPRDRVEHAPGGPYHFRASRRSDRQHLLFTLQGPVRPRERVVRSAMTLADYGRINREDSVRWFPAMTSRAATLTHLGFGIAGEAGEVVDLLKKHHRSPVDPDDWTAALVGDEELAAELVDVFTYLVQLAEVLDIDLHDAWEAKRAFNEARFA